MKKKLICFILAFCMIAGVMGTLSVSAATYTGSCGTNVTYRLNTSTGELTISGTGAMTDYDTWSSKAPWYYNNSDIKSVTIYDGVTSIGNNAFYNCRNLTSITIPDSVTSIGSAAFHNCSSLTSVTIPDSVTRIGYNAFSYCSSLTSVTIPDSVTSIDSGVFSYCSRLTRVTIPYSVTSIVSNMFDGCSRLTRVTIPYSVTSIGYAAFKGCSSLTSVTIPDSVRRIENYAFNGCTGLTKINWNAKNVADFSASNYVFYNAGDSGEGIKVVFGDNVKKIPAYCFWPVNGSYGAPKITSVIIGDSVTSIGDSAFRDGSGITNVTIPDSVTSIGNYAFCDCSSLTSVTIGDSVTSIGSFAFCGCSSLTSASIPESVTSIGNRAFDGCSLTSVIIPDGVTSIESRVFGGCSSLTSVTIPDGVTSIKDSAFDGCSSLTDVYYNGTIVEWAGISIDSFGNECLINATLHTEPLTGKCGENATFKLENNGTLTISGTGAMADYADAADMPWADYAGQITKIVIENGVTTVGARAFYGLSNVTEVEISDSVTAINTNAFRNCTSLTEISLPAGVTELGTYAFSGCSALTTVNMYNKVEKIGNFAFYNCKALTDVYFDGAQEDWDNVSIGSFNTGLTGATIHVKAAASVTIDGASSDYTTVAGAIAAADLAGKAVEVKLLINAGEIAIEPVYAHTIDLNGCTVGTFTVTGGVKLINGTVTTLNVDGIVTCENVTVTNTNAVSSGETGTKSVYTSYSLGVNIVEGAQVRIGGGLVDGKIDAGSGLRFIGKANKSDTLAGAIECDYFDGEEYADGYAIGIEISAEESDKKAYIAAEKWQEGNVFTAAVTGLSANNFNRNYTARCYVEYDGVKIFESGSTTRSMYAVAAGLLINNKAATDELLKVLNAYVNQTGVRLTLTKENVFSARMSGEGAYTGEAFFTVGETMYEEGMYMVTLAPIGQAEIDVDLFNSYVRINNNNSLVSPATFIMDNEDGTYTIVFDYSSIG